MKVTLLGATGLVGHETLRLLLANKAVEEITAVSRRDLTERHSKLKNEVMDLGRLGDRPDLFRRDAIICALGTTIKAAGSKEAFKKVDYDYPLESARLAKMAGTPKYLIVTATGASAQSAFFYNRVKGELEEALQALNFNELHIFRPSLLLGLRGKKRLGEEIAKAASTTFSWAFVGPLKRVKPVEGADVAAAIVREALAPAQPGVYIHESEDLQPKID